LGLTTGTYDLILAEVDADGIYIADSATESPDVIVTSGDTTAQDFTY